MVNETARVPLTGLILAGGKSTRFGSDKASALLLGRPLLQWAAAALEPVCSSLVVVRAPGQTLPPVDFDGEMTVVDDAYEAKGPLAGLTTGFAAVATPLCFAQPCDAPLVRPGLVSYLAGLAEGFDIVCPHVGGFLQPLAAVYRPGSCLPVFRDFIGRDALKITAAFGPLRTRIVREAELTAADPGLESFLSANRPEALHEIESLLIARRAP